MRSWALKAQGAPLFSMLDIIAFKSAGAVASSMTMYSRIFMIIDSGLISIGQASTQALQLVQAQSSSLLM